MLRIKEEYPKSLLILASRKRNDIDRAGRKEKEQMQEHIITLKNNTLFWLGDRFFKVETDTNRYSHNPFTEYTSRCPSCDSTRKIKYIGHDGNEYEAECPLCKGTIGKGYGNTIRLDSWQIHEYIVYKINAQGPATLSAYKDGIGYVDSISLTAFCKIGRCMDDYIETHIPWVENVVDPDISSLNINKDHFTPSDYVFRKRNDAEKFREVLKERDRKRLLEFNATYKTEHSYPY